MTEKSRNKINFYLARVLKGKDRKQILFGTIDEIVRLENLPPVYTDLGRAIDDLYNWFKAEIIREVRKQSHVNA